MATDIERIARGMVRKGTVCSTNPADMTVRVRYDEKDGTESPELSVLCQGAGGNKHYWLPDVGDQVLCIFEANDKNFSSGWVLGTFFTKGHPPQVSSQEIRRLDFCDGSFVEFDRASGNLTIECTGNITIKGANIYLN